MIQFRVVHVERHGFLNDVTFEVGVARKSVTLEGLLGDFHDGDGFELSAAPIIYPEDGSHLRLGNDLGNGPTTIEETRRYPSQDAILPGDPYRNGRFGTPGEGAIGGPVDPYRDGRSGVLGDPDNRQALTDGADPNPNPDTFNPNLRGTPGRPDLPINPEPGARFNSEPGTLNIPARRDGQQDLNPNDQNASDDRNDLNDSSYNEDTRTSRATHAPHNTPEIHDPHVTTDGQQIPTTTTVQRRKK